VESVGHTLERATRPSSGTADWTVVDAGAAAAEGLAALGLSTPLELVRDASAAVFRCGDLAVKVNAPGTRATRMRATYLALRESTCCLLPIAGPYETAHGVVTVWPWVDGSGTTGWDEVGRLLRAFHGTAGPLEELPRWRPFSRLPQQLAHVPDDEATVLRRAAKRLLRKGSRLPSDLGYGLIHGDVSVENTLRIAGDPVLIDLDFVAIGPREYDLVGALVRLRRGEIDAETYDAFCASYGYDVRSWAGVETVVDVCDLGALTYQLWSYGHHGLPLPDLTDALDRWR
jgi:hypothetical protein